MAPQVSQASSAVNEECSASEGWEDLQNDLDVSISDELKETGEDEDDNDSNKENISTKGRAGCPSPEDVLLLDKKLTVIQNEVQSLATRLGHNPSSILKLLVGCLRSGGVNTWSSYLKYYKANEEDELQRLPNCTLYDCKLSITS